MNCDVIRERLLDADPAELRAETGSDVSRHVATCPSCREAAGRLLQATETLGHVLDAVQPRLPVERALTRAAWAVRRRRRWWWAAVPALAAAGVAAVLLVSGNGTVATYQPSASSSPPVVQASPHQNVLVYNTENPNIVVVWLY